MRVRSRLWVSVKGICVGDSPALTKEPVPVLHHPPSPVPAQQVTVATCVRRPADPALVTSVLVAPPVKPPRMVTNAFVPSSKLEIYAKILKVSLHMVESF